MKLNRANFRKCIRMIQGRNHRGSQRRRNRSWLYRAPARIAWTSDRSECRLYPIVNVHRESAMLVSWLAESPSTGACRSQVATSGGRLLERRFVGSIIKTLHTTTVATATTTGFTATTLHYSARRFSAGAARAEAARQTPGVEVLDSCSVRARTVRRAWTQTRPLWPHTISGFCRIPCTKK